MSVIKLPKDIKKDDYDSFSDWQQAYKEAVANKKMLERKKKARRYKKVYQQKQVKAKERIKRNEKRKEETKKRNEEKKINEVESKRLIRFVKDKEFDFNKYRFIVDYYYKRTYFAHLTRREYEFLFFMYSEAPFTRKFFYEITKGFGYNSMRLETMIDKGIFYLHLDEKNIIDRRRKVELFDMTQKTRVLINRYYKTLLMCYKISERGSIIFKKTLRNTVDYHFSNHIKMFNERRDQWYNDVALEYNDPDRLDLNQHTFKDIFNSLMEYIDKD